MTPVPGLEAPVGAQVQALKHAFSLWAAAHTYLNFAETPRQSATFWTEQTYHRLRRITATVDPDGMIRSNHPIPPAG